MLLFIIRIKVMQQTFFFFLWLQVIGREETAAPAQIYPRIWNKTISTMIMLLPKAY